MDHFQRLIVALVFALLSGVAGASGIVSIQTVTGYDVDSGGTGYATQQAACDAYKPSYSSAYCGGFPVDSATAFTTPAPYGSCDMKCSGSSIVRNFGLYPVTSYTCPANTTKTGSGASATCTCNTGYVPNGSNTACVVLSPPTCKPAQLGSVQYEFPVTAGGSVYTQLPATMTSCSPVAATSTTAAGGCTHTYTLDLASRAVDGATTAIGNYRESVSGANCTPSGSANPVPASGPSPLNPTAPATGTGDDQKPTPNPSTICALGTGSVAMCPTLINGTLACVVCGQMASAGNGSSGAAPSGAASAPGATGGSGTAGQTVNTGSGTVGVPPGGSALQGTQCTGSVCVTTTFIKDSTGSVVGQYTSTTTATQHCAKDPGDPICVAQNTGTSGKPGTGGGSGSGGTGTGEETAPTFGGTCGAGFTCTGDAVQCAMARDQMLRNCQTLDNAASTDPVVVAAAAAASSPAGHPINSGTSKALTFDQTNIMSGSCPADVSVTVSHFNAVTLPFSSLCTPATWLGNILVGITALSCLGIVFVRGS